MRKPTPAALRTAQALFPRLNKRSVKIRRAAERIDLFAQLRWTLRTCAIILRDIEKSPEVMKNLDMKVATFALREVILSSGYKLDQLDDIIKQAV